MAEHHSTPVLLTVGVIAQRLGVPVHRIEYIIRARSVAPAGRAGGARVFSEAAVSEIESVVAARRSQDARSLAGSSRSDAAGRPSESSEQNTQQSGGAA